MSRQFRITDAGIPDAHKQVWVEVDDLGDRVVVRRADDPEDGNWQTATLPMDWLEEVKPPSIDDPEPLPLNIRAMAGGLNVDVVLSAVYPDGAQLKIDDSDDVISANLTPHGLRRLARAAWQRANAIEGGAS